MFGDLTALGYGIVTFAILVGVGTIVMYNFAGSVGCSADKSFNGTSGYCVNATNFTTSPSGTTYTNVNYLNTQLGSSGLAGWTPSIIAISVGLLFLGAFMIGKGKRR